MKPFTITIPVPTDYRVDLIQIAASELPPHARREALGDGPPVSCWEIWLSDPLDRHLGWLKGYLIYCSSTHRACIYDSKDRPMNFDGGGGWFDAVSHQAAVRTWLEAPR